MAAYPNSHAARVPCEESSAHLALLRKTNLGQFLQFNNPPSPRRGTFCCKTPSGLLHRKYISIHPPQIPVYYISGDCWHQVQPTLLNESHWISPLSRTLSSHRMLYREQNPSHPPQPIQIIISIYKLVHCGLRARDVSEVVPGIVEMNEQVMQVYREIETNEWNKLATQGVGWMSVCLSHWWTITRNMESMRSLTPSSHGAKVCSPVKWKGSLADHTTAWMQWMACLELLYLVCTFNLHYSDKPTSEKFHLSINLLHSTWKAWCSTLLSHPSLSQANTFDCQMPHEENTLPRPSPSRPNQCHQTPSLHSLFLTISHQLLLLIAFEWKIN